jgi:transposase
MLSLDVLGCRVGAVESVGQVLVVTVEGDCEQQGCPCCGYESDDVHSSYVRKPRDLPIQGRCVRLRVIVRRWRCLNRACARETFCESFKGLVRRHAQRTERMTKFMERFVLEASSDTAAHLLKVTGMEVSARTLLRVVDHGEVHTPTPKVLGVDDFALRRGRTYGTLLVDMETGKPIDVLLGRNRVPLQEWLKRHPGIEIVVRDRASAYADAVKGGAPEAIQVADRFHLVKNVSDVFKEVVDRQSWVMAKPTPLPVCICEPAPALPPAPAKRMTREQQKRAAAAGRLLRRYEEVHRLRSNGMSIPEIRNLTGLARQTIYTYLASSEVPNRAVSRAASKLDPFVEYVAERWQAGCHHMQTLYDEIVQLGYTGSISRLNALLQPWRAECLPTPAKAQRQQKTDRQKPKATWKEIRATLLCTPESLNRDQGRLLLEFLALNPPLALAYLLLQRFRAMLKEHDSEAFADWLDDTANSGSAPFERLAKGLKADRSAVVNAISLTWSTGPVEGHITRVKLLKRIGYGRASLPLLRARVLNSARRDSRPTKRRQPRKGASQNAVA